MSDDVATFDPFVAPIIAPVAQTSLGNIFASLPENKRGALLVIADLQGNARATLVAKLGEHWKVAAGATYDFGEKRPAGYVGLEGSW